MKHIITMKEIQNLINRGISTFMKKDNSPRGCQCVDASSIKPGDKIVIDNYFINIYVGGTFFRKRRIIHVLCLRQQRKITNSRSAKTLGTELLGRYPGNSVFTQNN